MEVGDPVQRVDEQGHGQEHEGEGREDGQGARCAVAGDARECASEPDRGDRPQPVDEEEAKLPAQHPAIDGQEEVFVKQPAGSEDGQDGDNGLSPPPCDRLEDMLLEPAMDPHVVPAPEVEHRMGQDGIAEAVNEVKSRQGERPDQQMVGTTGQQVDLESFPGALEQEALVGNAQALAQRRQG